MSDTNSDGLLYWVIPGVLAGMPMPFVDPERRLAGGGALSEFNDELPLLHTSGIRAVVSLLNIPSDAAVYESAGFSFLCLPIPDGFPPTPEQAAEFVRFVSRQRAEGKAVAVHCEAGLGRTGTMAAVYLISQGLDAASAIRQVRSAESNAVETGQQIIFLEQFAKDFRAN